MQTEARRIEIAATAVARAPELTVVVPTFNERDNIEPLLELLASVLEDVEWEVIFVDDDSADGTAARVREIAARDPKHGGLRHYWWDKAYLLAEAGKLDEADAARAALREVAR